MESKFTGSVWGMFGYKLLISLVSALTLGIAAPFMAVVYFKWEAKHTYINGQQLEFIGTGGEYFLKYLVWLLLTIITFGIYSIWVQNKVVRWKVSNTVFANQDQKVIQA